MAAGSIGSGANDTMNENIIGGIFDILHWASWADYIGYIGLTPYVDTQCGTIPIYSNSNEPDDRN